MQANMQALNAHLTAHQNKQHNLLGGASAVNLKIHQQQVTAASSLYTSHLDMFVCCHHILNFASEQVGKQATAASCGLRYKTGDAGTHPARHGNTKEDRVRG